MEKQPGREWQVRLDDGVRDLLSREAENALAALAALAWREPLLPGLVRPPDGSVGTVVRFSSRGGEVISMRLGGTAENLRTVFIEGENAAYGVNADLLDFAGWPDNRFREMALFPAGAEWRPTKISVLPVGGRSDLRLVLRRDDESWLLEEPVAWPAEEGRLDILLRWLDRLRADAVAVETMGTGEAERFGFGPHSAVVEAEYDTPDGRVGRRVEFGGQAGDGGLYARVSGRNQVFTVSPLVVKEIHLDVGAEYPKVWRDFYRRRSLNPVGGEMPSSLTVEKLLPSPVRLTMEPGLTGDWRGWLEEDGKRREFPIEPPDPAEPMRPLTALLAGLSGLRIQNFLSDSPIDPERDGLAILPAWRLSGRGADGMPFPALTLYAADPGGTLPPGDPFPDGETGPVEMLPPPGRSATPGIVFTLADRPAVMEAAGEAAYLLALPPYRYRSRVILDEDPAAWDRVEIDASGEKRVYLRDGDRRNEQWWRGRESPEPLLDGNSDFVAMLLELSRLRAGAWVASSGNGGEEFGLDRPAITAIVYTVRRAPKGKPDEELIRLRLEVGAAAGDGEAMRYARLGDSEPVFLISSGLAAALAVDYR